METEDIQVGINTVLGANQSLNKGSSYFSKVLATYHTCSEGRLQQDIQ